ncbi:hypothetical protein [Streptomyces flaveus]|uniref:hypothetical protein n=1 Tax=Streptomyces flaveus TaxID=66370 RepID=UPI003D9E05FC
MTTYEPRLGDTVEDTSTGKIGRVMGFVGSYVQLRPVGGGREWDARPDNLRAALLTQALSAGLAQVNAQSRTGAAVKANAPLPARSSRTGRPVAAAAGNLETLSAECTLAQRPDYAHLHTSCRQTEDVPLPHSVGILLVHRCACPCHPWTRPEAS